MSQTNWEGGKIYSSDEQRNIVSNFKDSVPEFDKGRWIRILLIGLAILLVLWIIFPASKHPWNLRPKDKNYRPQQEYKAENPFVAKAHDEVGAEARREAAQDVPGLARSPLIVDQADLFSERDEERLVKKATKVSDKHAMNIVVVTADSSRLSEDISNKSDSQWARDYADDFFDYHQYGEDGILMLISLEPRQVWISTSGTGIRLFTDRRIENMLDEIFKYADLKSGDYAMAPYIFIDHVELNLEKGWNENKTGASDKILKQKYLTPQETKRAILIATAIALVFYVQIRIRYASPKLPMLYDVRTRAKANQLVANDKYLRTDTSTRRIETSSGGFGGGGGGGGGSSTHSGSSGSSHGGGGRGF
ncbi:MAG TPA: TPM domain-containing protein [Clostridiaceae bacterium]|nr:TPM domain-containing protein [Clostridiaceae bacterium]